MNRDTSVDVDRACRDAYWHECAGNLAADRFPALSPPQPAPITRRRNPESPSSGGGTGSDRVDICLHPAPHPALEPATGQAEQRAQ
jgi:hypothetical protein